MRLTRWRLSNNDIITIADISFCDPEKAKDYNSKYYFYNNAIYNKSNELINTTRALNYLPSSENLISLLPDKTTIELIDGSVIIYRLHLNTKFPDLAKGTIKLSRSESKAKLQTLYDTRQISKITTKDSKDNSIEYVVFKKGDRL